MSFEEFVQACSPRLFRTALLLAGQDRAAAEDLLQLALERAYRHWARVCRSGEPERYVQRILANASNDRWRQVARRRERLLSPGDAGPLAQDQSDAVAERDYLMRALAALPPRQRTVLVLRYFNDLPEAEIADALTLYVGSQFAVTPISTATSKVGRPILIAGGVLETAITPDGKTLYVASDDEGTPGTVTPVNTATNKAGEPIHVGASVAIALTPDGKTLYAAGLNKVVPISTATNTPGKPIRPVSTGYPSQIVTTP